MKGATTLFNTYWIRFAYKDKTFEKATENSKILINAAKEAGVEKIVHLSITNASEDSTIPYFREKGVIEQFIRDSGLSYVILRPTMLFGGESILLNNIAWLLRKVPLFTLFGKGDTRIQPVFVEDVADIAVDAAQEEKEVIFDTSGPETFTLEEMVHMVADVVGSNAKIVHTNPEIALFFSGILGHAVHDVMLDRHELDGLMSGLLRSEEQPRGRVKLSEWLRENGTALGKDYISELKRHY
jgi:NADH dehydrogenase